MHYITWHAFPVWLLLATLVFEAVYRAAIHRTGSAEPSSWRFAAWAVRPWGVWAAFNLLVRLQGDKGFNNPWTFPFFANHWRHGESVISGLARLAHTPTAWGWTAVMALLACGLLGLALFALRQPKPSRRVGTALVAAYILAVLLPLALAGLPDGIHPKKDRKESSLTSSWGAHNTVLYAIPFISSKGYFLRHFLEIQPQLRRTIHGYSHPPGGSLSLYWIGRIMGVGGQNVRDQRVVIHYVVGLALFGALNVFVLYFLGSRLFRSPAVGLVTALLWVSMPATMTYSNFAQDTVYGVFFNLALLFTWLSVTARRQSLLWAVILGLVFYALVMLNYSWCLAATVFAVFAFIMGLREHWSRRDILVRGILPLATMTLLAAATFIAYRLDYWTAYTVSSEYVREWYRFTGPRQWLTALVGGQVDLLLMAGSVVASAIVVSLARLVATTTMIWSSRLGGPSTAGERGRWTRTPRRTSRGRSLLRQGFGGQAGGPSLPYRPEAVLLLVLLGVYAVPLLIGPTALKMETARCWSWVMSIPLAFAAATLLKQPGRTLFVCGAIAVSVATGTVMHLFLNFGP